MAGWVVGAPIPFVIMLAPYWGWIVAANVLLRINQGLAWFITGLNEFAGYRAVGVTALVAGYLASACGLRPEPFYLGVGYVFLGLLISALLIRDTSEHVHLETLSYPPEPSPLSFWEVFTLTSFRDRNLI